MLYIKLFIEREKNTGQSAPECPFNTTNETARVQSYDVFAAAFVFARPIRGSTI